MDAEGPMATRKAMMDVIRFWLSKGCDGFRVDMAGSLVKNDEDSKGTIALWQDVRNFLDKEYPNAAFVSEWGEPDKSLQAGFHMDFLLHFGPSHYNDLFRCGKPYFGGEGDASEFVKKYLESYEKSERKGLICIPSGNHDMERLADYIHDDRLKIAFAFLLSMPGAPYIYYGDEIGMRYIEGLTSKEGGYSRTGARSPMQWDDSVNAGFSSAPANDLYIPIDPDAKRPTVKKQITDDNSLFSEVKKLISVRQSHKALQNLGDIEFISDGANGKPLAYIRSFDGEKILVAINPADNPAEIKTDCNIVEQIYKFGEDPEIKKDSIVLKGKAVVFALI
jgi:maltose alpha-D-glucosyltransferase/alpha-amylase